MAPPKQTLLQEQFGPVLVESRPQPCGARKAVNFVFRMAILMVAPVHSIRWQMAKRRTGSVRYRAIDMAGL